MRLRVAGFPGVQALSPSHLVRHIAATKLRLAAKKVLGQLRKKGGKRKARKRRKKRRKKKRSKTAKQKTKRRRK